VQRSTGSWALLPVRTDYPTAPNPYERCSDGECGFADISGMQPMDLIVAGTVAVLGYAILWVVRHERAVRRIRSQPRV
jgi:hypothetical protein